MNYVRVLRHGANNVRLLLENGTTCLVSVADFESGWTQDESAAAQVTPRNEFINPEHQSDRIYVHTIRRGQYRTSVELPNGDKIKIPNEYFNTWLKLGSEEYYLWYEHEYYPTGRPLSELTFGVELEFVANPARKDDFCSAMVDLVGEDRFIAPLRYDASSTTSWSLQIDNSVRSTSSRFTLNGYELTSPILHFNEEYKEELSKVLDIITTVFEGKVNRTCGTHIHVGSFTFVLDTDDFRSLVYRFQRNYGRFEERVFDRLVSPSRKANNNTYCKSNNTTVYDSRYFKMNAKNLFEGFGTLENRQHQGTLDIKKIWSWMELNGLYMTRFFHCPDIFEIMEECSLESFMEAIGLSESTREFFLEREVDLN